ncbi:hypothetical protein SLE2022_280890 [Rubroshorea leprosula]
MVPSGFWCALIISAVVVVVVVDKTVAYSGSGPHIADVNILLPPKMTNPVEYRLQGSDGCFKWSWDHHDILSVIPEYNSSNHCSVSARLRSIAPYSGRQETSIYATDVKTGIVIRCKVFIDNFSRIQIFHSSIKLDLDGLATLRVRAFDSQENVFSSLVGLQFMWQLMPESDGLPHHLVHVPLKDSPLSDCGGLCGDLDIQIKLEDSGVFSDLFVVRGTEIGHERVSVHLLEPQLKNMNDKIVLTVAEAMSLDPPSPVFVLIGAALQYNLQVIRGNVPQVVTLPSPHHRWSVSNISVAQVDTIMGLTQALSLGVTTVIVHDTRVAGHIQVSTLHVVIPDIIYLYLLPLSMSSDPMEGMEAIRSGARWYVISGSQYLIEMKVFSKGPDAEEIYLRETDGVKLYDNQSEYWKTSIASKHLASKHGWQNSRLLKATSRGIGEFTASLTYYSGHLDKKEVLKVVQEIMVCDKVKFILDETSGTSQTIFLPWAPTVHQEMELKATGGCAKSSSDYKWFSSDTNIVSVSAYGVVQAKKPGKSTVKVVSLFDSLNYDEVEVEVSIPSSMAMLPYFPVETAVGSNLQAAVTMKAPNGAYFSKCDAFHSLIKWKAGSEFFIVANTSRDTAIFSEPENVENDARRYGPPCSWTDVYASGSGQAMLHATFSKEYHHFDDYFSGPIVLKATARIAAYPPLVLHQAGDGNKFGGYWFDLTQEEANSWLGSLEKLFLVPGTHLDVMLRGGPERWGKGIDFVETVETLGEELAYDEGVNVHQISNGHGNLYRILCQGLGSYKVAFKRGNLVGDDHPLPVVAEISLSLACSLPSWIILLVDKPVNEHDVIRTSIQADRSQGRICITPITVANGQTIRIAAVGVSSSGEAFANSSSLALTWELGGCEELAYWENPDDPGSTTSCWERFLTLQNESGMCTVRATVTDFSDTTSHSFSHLLGSSKDALTDAAQLQLVSALTVIPEFNLLFFSPDAKANLSIIGGSCFLEVVANDSRVVEVIHPPSGLQCSQLLLSPKGLGTALVTVFDIGLTPTVATSAVVQVADVDWIKITSGEEISVMEGSMRSVTLMAGINDGGTFDASQFAYMHIQVHIEDNMVELVDTVDDSNPGGYNVCSSNFKIVAKHLGITTLYVSARQHSGHEILSQVIKVEVYALPAIHPHDIFLLPGASYMLTLKGGPTISASVEYTSMDDGIATVHKSSGRITAISPGNITLLATVYGNGDTVICEAFGSITVGIPSSAILIVQSELLAVGREMPIYPSFSEGDLFSFYELCKNYKWTIEDPEVLSFHNMQLHGEKFRSLLFDSEESRLSGYVDDRELGFFNVLNGRASGRTTVSVSFSCDIISSGSYLEARTYSASLSLLVVPNLPMALGVPITWVFPPDYTTSSILPSSVDGQSRKGNIIYSLLRNYDERNDIAHNAISLDGDKVKTAESNSVACIQGKDRTTGRTEIAFCLRVAEVEQIRITNNQFPVHVLDVAVGAELKLPIVYCDALGIPFHEAHHVTFHNVETNYPDVVSISWIDNANANIHLKAMRHGRALLRVSIRGSPKKADYMLISVGAHVYPRNPVLHAGSCLNFSVSGFNDKISGQWHSSNESVISIDMPSGHAKAVGEGLTQVSYESSGTKLQTTVTVQPRNSLVMDAPKDVLTNVPFPSKGYSFSVKFSDFNGHSKVLESNKGAPYDCRVEPSFVGYAKPWMDLDTGHSYCLFFPYSPEHLALSIPKPKDMKPYVYVSINASMKEANHVSGSASALFIGGFSIVEMGKDLMQLNLTPDSNNTTITILGNTDVEIHWHDRNLLMVSLIYKDDFGIGGRAQYEVKVLRAKRFKDKIIISLPANGQRVELDVNYEPDDKRTFPDNTSILIWVIILWIIVAFFVISKSYWYTYFRYVEPGPRVLQPPPPPPPRAITAPVTPERGSPGNFTEQSPRTPQPFLEYVRRTIDETPYYKRQPRRRINAQNTF